MCELCLDKLWERAIESLDENPEIYDHNVWCKDDVTSIIMPIKVANEIIRINGNLIDEYIKGNEIVKDEEIYRLIRKSNNLSMYADRLTEEICKQDILNETGCFAKMHRSPKDSNWDEKIDDLDYLCCNSGDEILTRFIKSIRICDDLKDFISRNIELNVYLIPFKKPKLENEFRAFIIDERVIKVKQTPLANNKKSDYNEKYIYEIANNLYNETGLNKIYKRCCIDFEIMDNNDNNRYRIFEVNPFDRTTDLYIEETC